MKATIVKTFVCYQRRWGFYYQGCPKRSSLTYDIKFNKHVKQS